MLTKELSLNKVCSLVTPPPSSEEMRTKELSLKKVRGGVGRYGEVWGGMGAMGGMGT